MTLSIRFKIIAITVAILLIGIGATTITCAYIFSSEYYDILRSRGFAIAADLKLQLDRLLSLHIPLHNLTGFEEQCEELLNKYENVLYAMVVDQDGKVLFHNDASKHGLQLQNTPASEAFGHSEQFSVEHTLSGSSLLDVIVPVSAPNGDHIGVIIVGFPAGIVTEKTRNLISYAAGVGFIAFGLAMFLSYVGMSFWVTKPLSKLVSVIQKSPAGGLAEMVEIDIRTNDEIGQLACAFNDMTDSLKSYYSDLQNTNKNLKREILDRKRVELELKKHRDNLEEMVAKRTAELTRTNEALRSSEANYRAIFNGANDAIFVHNITTGQILDVNRKTCVMWGYNPEEFRHMTVGAISAGKPPYTQEDALKWIKKAAKGEAQVFEWKAKNKSGNLFWVEVNLKRVLISGKYRLLAVIRDITDRKKAAVELEKAKNAAISANKAKSQFLANMSHEIRTPLNGVIGMTGILLDTELTDEQRQFAETVKISGESLLTVINDILDYSKIEAGKLDIEILSFNLRSTMEDVADVLAVTAKNKDLELICLVHHEVPALVRGDPSRLRQILTNLVNNAIKFTQEGEVVIRATLEQEDDTHATVRFSVTDTGIGIPADRMNRLFQTFSQVDASTTRKYGGTGLGLAISKQLSEMMGGEIGVESEEGKGSTFWFIAVLEKQPKGRHAEIVAAENIRGKRILVVDDNATNRLVLIEQLKSWDCHIEEAEGGQQALDKLQQTLAEKSPFDIAIVDMQMPEMDGETLGRKIKADVGLKDTVLVMLSSMGQRGDAARMREIGFAAYLTKPVKQSQLYDCLATVTGSKIEKAAAPEKSQPLVTRHFLSDERKRQVRILLAEDNIINQQVALHILEKFGFRADAVANGQEAVKAIEMIPYDLVIMDVQMPEMDGLEATQRIRNLKSEMRKVPIIAMTAHAMKGDRERCLEAEMDDYITKPIEPDELLKKIESWTK